jgi:hypothetical protein
MPIYTQAAGNVIKLEAIQMILELEPDSVNFIVKLYRMVRESERKAKAEQE